MPINNTVSGSFSSLYSWKNYSLKAVSNTVGIFFSFSFRIYNIFHFGGGNCINLNHSNLFILLQRACNCAICTLFWKKKIIPWISFMLFALIAIYPNFLNFILKHIPRITLYNVVNKNFIPTIPSGIF